jgi:hypothetical protein
MVSFEIAVKRTTQYAARPLWDPATLIQMKGGCAHRRALEAMSADDAKLRALVVRLVQLESPTLFS